MFRLDGRVALVTGGSRGIGRASAEALAEHGAKVIVHYVRGEAAAREVADGIISRGGQAEIAGFDVADAEGAEASVAELAKRHGRLDVLVASAGIAIDALLLRQKPEDVATQLAVNLVGAMACAKAATRAMMKQRWGRVIFLSSIVGETGGAGQAAYAASKAGLIGVAKSLAREYAARQITVNAITPGLIETDMTAGIQGEARAAMLAQIPLGRAGTPRDVAAAVVYLASEEAAWVTGEVLRVNGGMLM